MVLERLASCWRQATKTARFQKGNLYTNSNGNLCTKPKGICVYLIYAFSLFLGTAAKSHQGSPNRWEPVRFDRLPVKPVRTGSGLVRYETGQNSKCKFELKKMKNFQKISKTTSRCDESNGVKFSQKSVHLVRFAEFIS